MFWVDLMVTIAKSYKSPANQEGTRIFQKQTYPVSAAQAAETSGNTLEDRDQIYCRSKNFL